MFKDDPPNVQRIERRLIEALNLEGVSPTDAINALGNLMVLTWARIPCPDCRKVAADRLRSALPAMLEEAGLIAADCHDLASAAGEQPHLH
jgi:hypothetical protein